MTTLPFGTSVDVTSAPAPAVGQTPTIVGVIGLPGAGAAGATTGSLHLVHTLAEALTLVGTDGALHKWATEYYARDQGEVLISFTAAHDATDDAARSAAAIAALDLFAADYGADGIHPDLLDIGDFGTNVESGDETSASTVVARLETLCEAKRMLGFANFPAAADDAITAWAADAATWAAANRKPRVMACVGTAQTAANADGIAASTVLVARRARLDQEAGITMPLGNKAIPGIVGTYPTIPYTPTRGVAMVGRTLQNTNGVAFVANYRGWKSVVPELAAAESDDQRFESILRAVDVCKDRYEDAAVAHLDDRHNAAVLAELQEDIAAVTAALIIDQIIEDANIVPVAAVGTNDNFRIRLRGSVKPIGVIRQIDIDLEVE